jgi:isoleucyl-tRNA synthetase
VKKDICEMTIGELEKKIKKYANKIAKLQKEIYEKSGITVQISTTYSTVNDDWFVG